MGGQWVEGLGRGALEGIYAKEPHLPFPVDWLTSQSKTWRSGRRRGGGLGKSQIWWIHLWSPELNTKSFCFFGKLPRNCAERAATLWLWWFWGNKWMKTPPRVLMSMLPLSLRHKWFSPRPTGVTRPKNEWMRQALNLPIFSGSSWGSWKSHLQNANLFSEKFVTLSFNDQMEDCGESSLATVGLVLSYHQCTLF